MFDSKSKTRVAHADDGLPTLSPREQALSAQDTDEAYRKRVLTAAKNRLGDQAVDTTGLESVTLQTPFAAAVNRLVIQSTPHDRRGGHHSRSGGGHRGR